MPGIRPALRALAWPMPAVAAWLLGWGVFMACGHAGMPAATALVLAGAAAATLSAFADRWWRRLIVAAGFPLSALVLGVAPALPGWAWGIALAALLLAYPLRTWRDAPFFPTARHALAGLDRVIELPPRPLLLDAGCGAGHGLLALREVWPAAQLEGIEWSRPLAWIARRRCRPAVVQRGDMWAGSWATPDLVYLFQRPETMLRALAKARREMRPGSWLVSLDFPLPGLAEVACLRQPGRRPVWVYRPAGARRRSADAAPVGSIAAASGR